MTIHARLHTIGSVPRRDGLETMKKIAVVAMIAVLATATACSSAPSQGDLTGDNAHSFLLHSAQIIDKINGDALPQGEAYLVIKYEVENLTSTADPRRQWTDQIALQSGEDFFEPIDIRSLDDQLWETSLAAGEAQTGYIVFTAPDEVGDFRLTVTFPVSGNEETYEFRPVDRRISVNTDFVLTRLEQIERTKRIPLIGGLLASFSSSPIRYLGTVLVPEEEIQELLDTTKDLSEDAERTAVEDYLLAKGHGRLE